MRLPNNASNTEMLIKDLAAKNEAMAAYNWGEKPLEPYRPYVSRYEQDDKPSVLITKPKKAAIVTRDLRGIAIDGTTVNANNLELSWTGDDVGSESLSATWDKWDGILSIKPGQYKLTATVIGGISHSVSFSVILKPAITAYTTEDIELLNTFQWADYNRSPEAKLVYDLAIEAGLVDKQDDFMDTLTGKKVTDKVKAFASNATGDFNLFYSGSGDKAFIDKKVTTIFGTHLSDETRAALIEKLESTAGFIDATQEFHEAMNNTLTIFFADNSIGKIISQFDTPLAVNPTMALVMDAAKTVVNVKLNIELALESNGAPLVMQEQAKKQLFDMVAIEVVGMAVGGVVLKAGSLAFKVVRSYFTKFTHKFEKAPKIFENKYPHDTISNAKVINIDTLHTMSGKMNYVVFENYTLFVCRSGKARALVQPGTGHIDLANGKKVIAAGEAFVVEKLIDVATGKVIRKQRLKEFDNSSGHYLPYGKNAQRAAEKAWKKAGYDVKGKYIEKYHDMEGGRGWIPVSKKI